MHIQSGLQVPGNAIKGSRNSQVVGIDQRIPKLEDIDVSSGTNQYSGTLNSDKIQHNGC